MRLEDLLTRQADRQAPETAAAITESGTLSMSVELTGDEEVSPAQNPQAVAQAISELPAREKLILNLLAGGAKEKEVAEALGLSDDSVQRIGAEAVSHVGRTFMDHVREQTELAVRDEEESVRLLGGPMDDWLVKHEAPVFTHDWYRTWPRDIAMTYRPGRYQLSEDGRTAQWIELSKN